MLHYYLIMLYCPYSTTVSSGCNHIIDYCRLALIKLCLMWTNWFFDPSAALWFNSDETVFTGCRFTVSYITGDETEEKRTGRKEGLNQDFSPTTVSVDLL